MHTEPEAEPRLLIDLPAGFIGLPVSGVPEQDRARVHALAGQLAGHAGESPERMAEHVEVLGSLLARNRIRLYGRFAVSDEHLDEPVLADLVVGVATLDTEVTRGPAAVRGNRTVAATELRRQYLARVPYADARVVALAGGAAMAAVTAGEYRLPPERRRRDTDAVLPRVTIEFQVPTPDGAHLIVLTVGTASEAGCQAVFTEAVRVADSIRLESAPDAGAR